MKRLFILLTSITILASCIGTDIQQEILVEETLAIDQFQINLLVDETLQLSAVYTDSLGRVSDTEITWLSSDTDVFAVSNDGLITGTGEGQAFVTAVANSVESESLQVTVVTSLEQVAKVLIDSVSTVLEPNQSLQLNGTAWNVRNSSIEDKQVQWSVSDTNVAIIDSTGLLTAVNSGMVDVTATIDSINSDVKTFTVGSATRTGTLMGVNGYVSRGMATLSVEDNGDIFLRLSEDFDASIALGTFIYLANTTNGRNVRAQGLDLGEIRSGGAKEFNVSSVNPSATLDTYDYVIVLCRPASITFGQGKLN